MKNNHFVLCLVLVIFLAKLAPSIGCTGGILRPEITVKYVAVIIIFLNSGLTLPTEHLAGSILQWDVHLVIQTFTFIAFPAIVAILVMALRYTFLQPALLDGITILSTMPPPVSSAIILTKAVGGNEGAAVFNSVFGSMLGIIVTPNLILLLIGGRDGYVPTNKIFQKLFMTVVVPLLIGQVIRTFHQRWLDRQNIPFPTIGQVLILFIIYTTFCDTFSRTDFELSAHELAFTVVLMIFLLFFMEFILLECMFYIYKYTPADAICIMYVASHKNLALVFITQAVFMVFLLYSSSYSNFPTRDCITIMFCGTHKSLTLGIPMIEIIFEGSPVMSRICLPLLIYNPAQIVLGALTIGRMQNWLERKTQQRRQRSITRRRSSRRDGNHYGTTFESRRTVMIRDMKLGPLYGA